MDKVEFKPFVPAESELTEFSLKAVVLGVLMAIILGAANAYLGMKAGLTVAATFPAAVVAMAALRVLKGTVLEENVAVVVVLGYGYDTRFLADVDCLDKIDNTHVTETS